MHDVTRYGRVKESVRPMRQTDSTVVHTARMLRPFGQTPISQLFGERQRAMASAVCEERRSGLYVIAVHREFGQLAQLWLEASSLPRAGLIGRHEMVDLALPLDDALSLRHLMFVVRRRADGVHFQVLDLETPNGVYLEDGRQARLVSAPGPLIVSASDFVFFCFLTGDPLPWNPDAPDAWATLLSRTATVESARGSERREGTFELGSRFGMTETAVTRRALDRGVLIGRDSRCDVVSPLSTVSRVHAVALRLDDELFLFDAGSTNGLSRGGEEVWVARLTDGDVFELPPGVTLAWRQTH